MITTCECHKVTGRGGGGGQGIKEVFTNYVKKIFP